LRFALVVAKTKMQFKTLLYLGLAVSVAFVGGCKPKAAFRKNRVQIRKVEQKYLYERDKETKKEIPKYFSKSQLDNFGEIMVGLFGTPDEPRFPGVTDDDGNAIQIVSEARLKVAAGPVGRDANKQKHGLYREHCAHCHGISGDGAGATAAFLNPYPRNYRPGWFKFKSTPGKSIPPTNHDLNRVLMEGIPDTAMPSFRLLTEAERSALIDYVKYLSVRGEVGRRLIEEMGLLEPDTMLLDFSDQGGELYAEQLELINTCVSDAVQKWSVADASILKNAPYPEEWRTDEAARQAAIERGREMFFTSSGNCFTCHGDTAIGDGQTNDYDDWTKDVYTIDQKTMKPDPIEVKEFTSLGAMKPRNVKPRNLRLGVYRGGRRPIDVFARIKNGIAGTPMPGNQKLSDEDVWAIVEYVLSIPYEPLSQPPKRLQVNERRRAS
jgi:mono/diheme cytochrome c family protein